MLETEAGYTGGSLPNPSYSDVHTGKTGHAEAVRVVFDPTKISYAEVSLCDLLDVARAARHRGASEEKVNASGKWKPPS